MKPLKLGIVGTGKISAQLCDALSRTPQFLPAAVLSREKESGAAFARAHGIAAVYTEEAAFLASDIDAVYIATPNCLHAEGTIAALSAGKHVLCEKPISTCTADLSRMYAAADRNGTVLLEAMRPLHDPFFAALRDALPRVGRVRQVKLIYCQYSSRYDAFLRGERPRAFDPTYHNAALMDIGVYPAAIAAALFGQPRDIQAGSIFLDGGFEGCGEAILGYGDFSVTLTYSKIHDAPIPSVICGEEGCLSFLQPNAPRELTFYPRGGEAEVLGHTPAENNMVYELRSFAELIEKKETAHPFREISVIEAKILDAIRERIGLSF